MRLLIQRSLLAAVFLILSALPRAGGVVSAQPVAGPAAAQPSTSSATSALPSAGPSLEELSNQAANQVVYLGTAGAILDYRVGDVVIPNQFINFDTSSAPFEQNAGQLYSGDLARGPNVHAATKHGRVPTLYHETLALLHGWKEKSVAAMDVEGYYLARFAQEHKDLKMAAFFSAGLHAQL